MPCQSGASQCFNRVVSRLRISAAAEAMTLSELLQGLATLDARTGAIATTGVTADSRKVKPGNVFVAVPGTKADGLAFAAQAAAAGAAAIIGEGASPGLHGTPFVKVE